MVKQKLSKDGPKSQLKRPVHAANHLRVRKNYGERSSTISLRESKTTSDKNLILIRWKKNPTPRVIILGCRNSQRTLVMRVG